MTPERADLLLTEAFHVIEGCACSAGKAYRRGRHGLLDRIRLHLASRADNAVPHPPAVLPVGQPDTPTLRLVPAGRPSLWSKAKKLANPPRVYTRCDGCGLTEVSRWLSPPTGDHYHIGHGTLKRCGKWQAIPASWASARKAAMK